MQFRNKQKRATRRGVPGQAAILMAIVIALLFSLFTLVFEVGRLLIARQVLISATRRAGEAGLSYMVDYARSRADFNEALLNAQRNTQVWTPYYDETTGVPKFMRGQMLRYLQLNLQESGYFFPKESIEKIGVSGINFPYKEANWPTSTIGARLTITAQVPLVVMGGFSPSIPITVQETSITTLEEILGIPTNEVNAIGAGGSASEFAGEARKIPGSSAGWYEPFQGFLSGGGRLIAQEWGCPPEFVSAYSYANGRHAGMDFSVPETTRLYAVAKGRIISAGPYPNQKDPKVGNMSVILEVPGNLKVTYLHMLELSVKVGQEVEAGQLLGTSDGDPKRGAFAGFSSGAHLHFQVAQTDRIGGINFDFPYDIDPGPLLGLPAASPRRQPNDKNACNYGPPPPPAK
jgi:murein DD-endopeptidase MepM/ murein hydrolase activator NlpD